MSSDEVNSISDTVESLQVANILKEKYYDLVTRVNLPEHQQIVQLSPSLDVTRPTLMYVPGGVAEISWLRYFNNDTTGNTSPGSTIHDLNLDLTSTTGPTNVAPGYLLVDILPVKDFIEMVTGFNPSETNVLTYTFSDNSNSDEFAGNYTLYAYTDRTPSYCTIVSNYQVLFDAYDSSVDSTLQGNKTMAWARVIPQWKMTDTFIPDLDDEQFQLLYNEAKALAFFELKQQVHSLAEQEKKRGWTSVQKNKSVSNKPSYFDALPNFGRQGGGFTAPVSYFKARKFDTLQ